MASTELTFQGLSMPTYSQVGYNGIGYNSLLSGAMDMGANTVALSSVSKIDLNTGKVDALNSSSLQTVPLTSIEIAIKVAHEEGLDVFLKPQIYALTSSSTGIYSNLTSNTQSITDVAKFFAGYKAYILEWATIAETYDVPLLSLGSEMLRATKPQFDSSGKDIITPYWEDIIASIREVYHGKLTYSAVVDLASPLNNEVQLIKFWDKLDYVGIDVYPVLTGSTADQFDASWLANKWVEDLAAIAHNTGKQIVFTDTGMPGVTADATPVAWYQSFMNTWTGSKQPDWLAGTFLWNHNPTTITGENDAIFDSTSAIVVASIYGGINSLHEKQTTFTGSDGNDRIELYGNAAHADMLEPVHDLSVIRAQTFSSTVTITLDGTIINGKAPTVHIYINDQDMGIRALSTVESADRDSLSHIRGTDSTFQFSVDSLDIRSIKVVMESPVLVDGQLSHIYLSDVKVANNNNVYSGNVVSVYNSSDLSLASATVMYDPETGTNKSFLLSNTMMDNGGTVLITPLSYASYATNLALLNQPGTIAQPLTVNGGAGFDTVYALGSPSQYLSITPTNGKIVLTENSDLHQNATLNAVERVAFADGSYFQDGTIYKPADIYADSDGGGGGAGVILAGVGTLGLLAFFVL